MHPTAKQGGIAFFQCYGTAGAQILDVGSRDVNGSLRGHAPPDATYVGIDLEPGKSVDVVVAPGEPFPFADENFDLAVSVSCFEHDAAFWETIAEIARVLRPGGHFYLNAPSNGVYHSYPSDNWRFYPDAGIALAKWTQHGTHPLSLIESGIVPQAGGHWSDFYAVFRRGPAAAPRSFIADRLAKIANLRRLDAPIERFIEPPEDIRARRKAEKRAARAEARLDEILASRSWKLTAPLRWLGKMLHTRS